MKSNLSFQDKRREEFSANRQCRILLGISILMLALVWVLNETNVFRLNSTQMRLFGAIGLAIMVSVFIVTGIETEKNKPYIKYLLIFALSSVCFIINMVFTFHAAILVAVPMVIGFQYESKRLSLTATVCSVLISTAAPVLGFVCRLWEKRFPAFLYMITSGERVTASEPVASENFWSNLLGVLVYICLTNLLFCLIFGVMLRLNTKRAETGVAERLMLTQIGRTDSLTELYNQNFFLTVMSNGTFEGNVGVIFFDINNMKSFNDLHGHNFGDLLIKRCAESIKRALTDEAAAFRIGGDEFVIITQAESREDLDSLLDRWQKALAEVNCENEKEYGGLECSLSYGTAYGDASGLEELVHEADMMMYENKKSSGAGR